MNTITSDPNALSVQFGCGVVCPVGWLNYDVSPTMIVSKIPLMGKIFRLPAWNPRTKYGNVVKGLPVPDKSCVRVYSDQVLEHLALEDFRTALRNIHRILMVGGTFRFFVPDIAYCVNLYLEGVKHDNPDAMHDLTIGTGMGLKTRRHGMLGRFLESLGNSRHQWGWDEASVRKELTDAGFHGIRRIYYRDSEDVMFKAIEDYSEYRDSQKSQGMEARR